MGKMVKDFYNNKRVLITGHTGFKGSWLVKILQQFGAQVYGYSLEPNTTPSLFNLCGFGNDIDSCINDIRDKNALHRFFSYAQPEIIFHLAAQPLVKDSYVDPVYTYETNVLGTVYLLDEIRNADCVRSVVNVTTDKVYDNKEWIWGYRETDPLNGYDPYSNSKSCSDIITQSYKKSFFDQMKLPVSTARAGNVIGGGDFAGNRIVPDCVRAALNKESIIVRNPQSIRPYQHVLEPLFAYLIIAQKQQECFDYAGCYNIGPDENDCITTGDLVEIMCKEWGHGLKWEDKSEKSVHEARLLKLDCALLKDKFQWHPIWSVKQAIQKTVEWTKVYASGCDINDIMNKQIDEYMKELGN